GDGDCAGGGCAHSRCEGGPTPGYGCLIDNECGAGGTCVTFIQPCPICNPITKTCNGGPSNGATCTPGDSNPGDQHPTSLDGLPAPSTHMGDLPIAFALTTGAVTATAQDLPGQSNVFCGFCATKVGAPRNPAAPCTSDTDCAAFTPFIRCQQKTAGAFGPFDP